MNTPGEQYELLFNGSQDAIFIADAETGIIVDCNPAATELTSRSRESLIGSHQKALHPLPEDENHYIDVFKKHVAENGGCLPDGEIITGDSRIKHVTINASSFEVDGVKFLQEVFRDTTPQRVADERLRQAEKMEAIGQLSGGIAHDFNNQLTAILGYSNMLVDELSDERHRDFARQIWQSARHSTDLTRQLMLFSRKEEQLSVAVDIHRVISETVSILERSIDKRIDLRQILGARPSTISGNPSQLANMILNIAINARDAMPNGGSLIFTTDTADLDKAFCDKSSFDISPGEYIQLSIIDTGTGMTEETRRHIFEPFYTTKAANEGTGLGLARTREILVRHCGALSLQTETGRGSTFTFYFPLSRNNDDGEPEIPEAEQFSPARPAKILLVDDEESVRDMLIELLSSLGYTVTGCASSPEAVKLYRSEWQEIDLVILDMMMPKLNGKDTFIAMKEINPNIRAVACSAYAKEAMIADLQAIGIADFLEKPFAWDELAAVIEEVLCVKGEA